MDEIQKRLFEAVDIIMSEPAMIEKDIEGDDKFYLAKTKYRLEIRSKESNTWLTYVMRPIGGDDSYKEYLLHKYSDLVMDSDPKHFEEV